MPASLFPAPTPTPRSPSPGPAPSELLQKARIQVWLYEQAQTRLEGRIIGFDEFMNVVLDDAEEVSSGPRATGERRALGRILLKGDNITLIQTAPAAAAAAPAAAAGGAGAGAAAAAASGEA
jgi:small nuclear ribonucleoprotein E